MNKLVGLMSVACLFVPAAMAEAPAPAGLSLQDLVAAGDSGRYEVLETGVVGPVSVLVKSPLGTRFMLAGADCIDGERSCRQVIAIVEYETIASINDKRVKQAQRKEPGLRVVWQPDQEKITMVSLLDVPPTDAKRALNDFMAETLLQAGSAYTVSRTGDFTLTTPSNGGL